MFRITNIEDINRIARELGNKVITEVSDHVRKSISDSYIFVRYMGPKFAIVFSGVEEDSLEEFLKNIKEEVEELEIVDEDDDDENDKNSKEVSVSPKLNFVISTYYKGTGIEKLTKKLEEYIDSAPKDENQINYI